MAELLGEPAHPTADGRIGVSPRAQVRESRRVGALVMPCLDDDLREPALERLTPAQALPLLFSSRAILRDEAWQLQRFELHAGLLERLPVFRVRLPRGSLPDGPAREALLARLAA